MSLPAQGQNFLSMWRALLWVRVCQHARSWSSVQQLQLCVSLARPEMPGLAATTACTHVQPPCAHLQRPSGVEKGVCKEPAHLQISDFALDWPSSAQWLPKWTSAKTPGKCCSTQAKVGAWMQCCREVTTTSSQDCPSRCRLWNAPVSACAPLVSPDPASAAGRRHCGASPHDAHHPWS